jgi:hypothetical protein
MVETGSPVRAATSPTLNSTGSDFAKETRIGFFTLILVEVGSALAGRPEARSPHGSAMAKSDGRR